MGTGRVRSDRIIREEPFGDIQGPATMLFLNLVGRVHRYLWLFFKLDIYFDIFYISIIKWKIFRNRKNRNIWWQIFIWIIKRKKINSKNTFKFTTVAHTDWLPARNGTLGGREEKGSVNIFRGLCLQVKSLTLLLHRGKFLVSLLLGPWPGELTYFPLCFQIPASAQHWGLLFSQNGFGNWMVLFSITDASPTAPLAVPQKPSPCPRHSHRENLFPDWFPQILPLGFESILHRLEMVPPSSFIHLFTQRMFNSLLCARL